jgi:hypothetical protein
MENSDQFNLRKHPELFYLGDQKFHVCPICLKRWYCETIINYGFHDMSESVEVCYNCSGVENQVMIVDPSLPEWIVKKLIESHEDAKIHAEKIRQEEAKKLKSNTGDLN